jgi:AcrR family transcriptional regulator
VTLESVSQTGGSRPRYHHGDLPNALRAAAVDLIAERGPAGFSLREVARRAGVSHAAPTHHFGDRAGLLTSVAVDGFSHLGAEMDAALMGEEDPARQLVGLGRAYVRVALARPAHFAVMFRTDLVRADDANYAEVGGAVFDRLLATVARLRDRYDGGFDVEQAALLCWSMAHGLSELSATGPHAKAAGAPPEDLIERFTWHLLDGLLPDGWRGLGFGMEPRR